jgi:aminoglycoside phosphotransferase (APT) family kinase protein
MNTFLETEILAALEQSGIHIRSFIRISNFHLTPNGRSCYRIDHDHGIVKARLLEDEPAAQQLAAFRRELPDDFTPLVSQHGRVLIEEWIDGNPLPDMPGHHWPAIAGAILGDLHARPTFGQSTLHEMHTTEDHHLAAQQSLRRIAITGALGEKDVARLERILQRYDPLQATYGLVHFDFCGENMVIDRAGRLRIVDNERIGLNSLCNDLMRTWYRWALPAPEWDSFCNAYTSRLPFPNPPDSFPFWKIVAIARSAELRLSAYPEKAGVPLGYLKALAAEEGL